MARKRDGAAEGSPASEARRAQLTKTQLEIESFLAYLPTGVRMCAGRANPVLGTTTTYIRDIGSVELRPSDLYGYIYSIETLHGSHGIAVLITPFRVVVRTRLNEIGIDPRGETFLALVEKLSFVFESAGWKMSMSQVTDDGRTQDMECLKTVGRGKFDDNDERMTLALQTSACMSMMLSLAKETECSLKYVLGEDPQHKEGSPNESASDRG